MPNNMSQSKFAALGELFGAVWSVEQVAHAASVRNTSMSLVCSVLAMSSSIVRNIVVIP
jgi:hypothetical protein